MKLKDASIKLEEIKHHYPIGDSAWWYQRGICDALLIYTNQESTPLMLEKFIEDTIKRVTT